jgi:excisionase family DNA binding protein
LDKQYYQVGEVARLAKVDVTTVRRWIRNGKLKATGTLGGHWRISQEELFLLLSKLSCCSSHEGNRLGNEDTSS